MKNIFGKRGLFNIFTIGILINCAVLLLGPGGKLKLQATYYKLVHAIFPIADFPDPGSGVIEVRHVMEGRVVSEEVQIKSAVKTTHEHLPPLIESRIDGLFTGFDQFKIYKLDNGQIWYQTANTTRTRHRTHPKVTLNKNGAYYDMWVARMEQPVQFQLLRDGQGTASYSVSKNVLEDHITNRFSGFRKGHIFALDNGQIWEQVEAYTEAFSQSRPEITIYKIGDICRLNIDGIGHAVRVERVK